MAAFWGLAGGMTVEALVLYTDIRHTREWNWRRPIPQGMVAYLISVILRVAAGAGLAAAAAGSGQVSGSLAAFGLGIAAPLVVEKLAETIPLHSASIVLNQGQASLTEISSAALSTLGPNPEQGFAAIVERESIDPAEVSDAD